MPGFIFASDASSPLEECNSNKGKIHLNSSVQPLTPALHMVDVYRSISAFVYQQPNCEYSIAPVHRAVLVAWPSSPKTTTEQGYSHQTSPLPCHHLASMPNNSNSGGFATCLLSLLFSLSSFVFSEILQVSSISPQVSSLQFFTFHPWPCPPQPTVSI